MVNLRSQISWQSMLSWLLSPLRAKNKKNRAALLHILFWASEYTQIRFWKKNNSFWTSIWKTINACGDNCSSLRQPWRLPEAWWQPCCVIVVLKAFHPRGFRISLWLAGSLPCWLVGWVGGCLLSFFKTAPKIKLRNRIVCLRQTSDRCWQTGGGQAGRLCVGQGGEATLEIARGMVTAMLCYCCAESIQLSRIQNLYACGENCSSRGMMSAMLYYC